MRIRKRFHLLSSLTSDPQVINKPLVVQVQDQNGYSDLPNQPSDGQLTKKPTWVSQTDDLLSSSKNQELEHVNDDERRMEQEDEDEKNKTSSNDIIIRKECILNEEVNISSLASFSSPSDQVDRRWSGDGLVVPLKKRKRSFKISTKEDDDSYSNPEWKSKTNKKSSLFQDDDNLQLLAKTTEVYVGDDIGNSSTRKTKNKKIRGSVIMEGSRCSRMNGRGWRCCQPTLVGYSLCEHHLGKGRLRTMSSVTTRNQNLNQKQPMGTSTIIVPKDDDEQTQELRTPSWIRGINLEEIVVETAKRNMDGKDDDDDEVSRVVVNKTRKLGKMRARSMSSLLVAIDNATLVASQQPPQKQ